MKDLDLAFLHRVYRTTLWVWGVAVILSLGFPQPVRIIIGLTLGTVISLMLLRTLEWTVLRATEPEKSRIRYLLPVVQLIKYVIVGAIFYCALRSNLVSAPALAFGLSLTWLVIVLKVIGSLITERPKGTEE